MESYIFINKQMQPVNLTGCLPYTVMFHPFRYAAMRQHGTDSTEAKGDDSLATAPIGRTK